MTGTDSYSITPASNATADGGAINWAEGQPPSSVNNTARQWMADQRASFNDLIWFQYGTGDQGAGNLAVPAVYASGTSFTIAGADVTLAYHVGRRVRAVGSGTGTIYGSISITSYAPTTTTVTVVWDSGSLSNETLVISLSQIPVTGRPVPFNSYTPISWTPADVSGASLTFSSVNVRYLQSAGMVFVFGNLTYPATGDVTQAQIGGLPVPVPNHAYALIPGTARCNAVGFASIYASANPNSSNFFIYAGSNAFGCRNVDLSGATVWFSLMYPQT